LLLAWLFPSQPKCKKMAKLKNIAEYISASPKEAQKHLREMRAILKKAAPKANEDINLKKAHRLASG